jgi:hypothetical protein
MKQDEHKGEAQIGTPAAKDPGKDPRRDRLKLALRENLKRRKSQARERGDVTIAPSTVDKPALDEGLEKKPGK